MKKLKGLIIEIIKWFVKDILAKAVTAPIIVFLVTFGGSLLDIFNRLQSPTLTYIQEHPIRITIAALFFGFFASSLYVFARKYLARKRLIEATGLTSFWPHSTPEQKSDNWANCLHLVEQGASDLRILGATGWKTFGSLDAPLHNAIRSFKGDIRILLMDPACPFLRERAESIGMKHEDYAEEIKNTIECCRLLKKSGKKIQVKTYIQKPIWKMIIINNFMWLQHYSRGKHVDETPVYGIFNNASETSLFLPLYEVFRKRWNDDGNKEVI